MAPWMRYSLKVIGQRFYRRVRVRSRVRDGGRVNAGVLRMGFRGEGRLLGVRDLEGGVRASVLDGDRDVAGMIVWFFMVFVDFF